MVLVIVRCICGLWDIDCEDQNLTERINLSVDIIMKLSDFVLKEKNFKYNDLQTNHFFFFFNVQFRGELQFLSAPLESTKLDRLTGGWPKSQKKKKKIRNQE